MFGVATLRVRVISKQHVKAKKAGKLGVELLSLPLQLCKGSVGFDQVTRDKRRYSVAKD